MNQHTLSNLLLDLESESEDEHFVSIYLINSIKTKSGTNAYLRDSSTHGEFKLSQDIHEEVFKSNFRLSREQFDEVHETVKSDITDDECNAQKPIGSLEKPAVCLRKVAGEGLSSTKYIWQPLEASNNAAIKLEENDITLENLAERQQEALYDPLSENHDELGQSTQESLCKAEALSTDEESPENASRIRLIETFSDTQLNNVFTTATPHTRLNPVEIHSASGSSDISKDPTQQSLRIRPINLLKQNNLSRKSAQQNKIPSEVQRTINEKLSAKKIRLVETFSGPSSGTSRESAQQMLRLVPVESVSLNESTLNRTPIEQNPWDPLAFNIIGNRIASIQFLFRKLQEVFTHCQKKGCNPKSVQIISEESDGLNSEILIRCANCATDFEIPLTDPLSLKSCDLNMSILTKDIVSKLGHSGVNAMLENIELPQISSEKYSEVLQSISEREENVVYIKQEVEVKEEPVDY